MTTPKPVSIIAVTGTKGKTSVVQLIASALEYLQPYNLRVDNDRVCLGNEQLLSPAESMEKRGLIPTVSPGEFLAVAGQDYRWSGTAVLECSIGCATKGLGFESHNIGVFTNIYSDHIGKRYKSRDDLADAKSFIITHIKDGGTLVYNADEPLIAKRALEQQDRINLESVSLAGNGDWSADSKNLLYKGKAFIQLSELPWIIHPDNTPYVFNALYVAATLKAYGVSLEMINNLLPRISLDPLSARMELLGTDQTPRVLLTFAHERESLTAVYSLAKKLAGGHVVRAAIRTRTSGKDEQLLESFVSACMPFYDLVIYEKTLDYIPRRSIEKMGPELQSEFQRQGREIPYIADERDALETLFRRSDPGDIIVHVINGDAAKSRKIAIELLT